MGLFDGQLPAVDAAPDLLDRAQIRRVLRRQYGHPDLVGHRQPGKLLLFRGPIDLARKPLHDITPEQDRMPEQPVEEFLLVRGAA